MNTRNSFNTWNGVWLRTIFVLGVSSSTLALEDFHYGVRTDILQPIYGSKNWLWYANLHTQIPSLDRYSASWLVNASTGMRFILTSYFTVGPYFSFGHLNEGSGKSYWFNPGIECFFPLAKLGIHYYFMMHHSHHNAEKEPIGSSNSRKQGFDMRLSSTFLPFMRPFISVHCLSKDNYAPSASRAKPFNFSWGLEWLMTPQYSFELQNDIGTHHFTLRFKSHSSKVYRPLRRSHVGYYLREPIDQYTLPISRLDTIYPTLSADQPVEEKTSQPSSKSKNVSFDMTSKKPSSNRHQKVDIRTAGLPDMPSSVQTTKTTGSKSPSHSSLSNEPRKPPLRVQAGVDSSSVPKNTPDQSISNPTIFKKPPITPSSRPSNLEKGNTTRKAELPGMSYSIQPTINEPRKPPLRVKTGVDSSSVPKNTTSKPPKITETVDPNKNNTVRNSIVSPVNLKNSSTQANNTPVNKFPTHPESTKVDGNDTLVVKHPTPSELE